jgi:anti-sigma regulatory factor (Ser/Thr protein kinase)
MLIHRARDGRTEWHAGLGIPLGAVRGGALRKTLEDRTLTLEPGDLLVQYTDGYTEAFDPAGREQFGAERLEALVKQSASRGCHAVIASLTRAVEAWTGDQPPMDDETLLVVGRMTKATPAGSVGDGAGADREDEPEGFGDALEVLEQARRGGLALALQADVAQLERLPEWLARIPDVATLEPYVRARLESALHEVCANVIEHGYQGDPAQRLELWWLAAPQRADGGNGAASERRVRGGRFVLHDRGFPFSPGRWRPTDFTDRAVWKRGRGYGLDILHRTLQEVRYHPGTPAGNITIMAFDPAQARDQRKEQPHV